MKRLLACALALALLLTGCAEAAAPEQKYTATFLYLFDTVTTIVGHAESEAQFQETAQSIHDGLQFYHQLFDIYNDYPGINNLKTVNDNAGLQPVVVDGAIIALLQDCKRYEALTDGRVNVALGGVLRLWHEARSEGIQDPVHAALPDMQALKAAAQYTDLDALVIDEVASTVYISDARVQLDVGAIAKGWAVQRVAQQVKSGLLISVGGNVCATGPKKADGTPWVVGIQNPDGKDYLHTLFVSGGCVVTSGDYQRSYVVDGKAYHHIIAPDTLMPAALWRSVTVVCSDSGLADALSTALFLLPLQQGQELLAACGAEAMWLDAKGQEFFSPGFEKMIRT